MVAGDLCAYGACASASLKSSTALQEMDALQQHRAQITEQLQAKGDVVRQQQKGVPRGRTACKAAAEADAHLVCLSGRRSERPAVHADAGADGCQDGRAGDTGPAPQMHACNAIHAMQSMLAFFRPDQHQSLSPKCS